MRNEQFIQIWMKKRRSTSSIIMYKRERKPANSRIQSPSPHVPRALARLAEASARIRLSETATIDDAKRAVRLTKLWRYDLMGDNFDETANESGRKGSARHADRTILDIVERLTANGGQGYAQLLDVINEAEREGISRDKAETVIEKLNNDGILMRPIGYDTLQRV